MRGAAKSDLCSLPEAQPPPSNNEFPKQSGSAHSYIMFDILPHYSAPVTKKKECYCDGQSKASFEMKRFYEISSSNLPIDSPALLMPINNGVFGSKDQDRPSIGCSCSLALWSELPLR